MFWGPEILKDLIVYFRFDTGGPGSCLKRYSDPNFFKRASAGYDDAYAEKLTRDKKARRRKVHLELLQTFLFVYS